MEFDAIRTLRNFGVLESDARARAEALAGGFWNDVVRVRCGGDDLVVKHFGARSAGWTLFPIEPAFEARALELLSGSDIAPEPVGFWPAGEDRGAVLVYRFVPGKLLENEVTEAARLVRRAHLLAAEGFRVMPLTPAEIMADADRLPGAPLDDPLWIRLAAVRPEPVEMEPLAKTMLIHGDFGTGNIITGKEGTRIIDWQCPGMGDGAEDLWSFLSPAFQAVYGRDAWTQEQVRAFREAYGDAQTLVRLDLLSPYFSYRYAHYCVFRVHQLKGDSAAQERYRQAALAGVEVLEALGSR
jgi:thiamine kinase